MKKSQWLGRFVALAGVGLLIGVSAHAGKETDNGGNDVGIEFSAIAEQALMRLKISGLREATPKRLARLKRALQTATILSVEDSITVVRDGVTQKCVAVNDPARKLIKVSKKWDSIASSEVKSALAIHELEGLIGEESTGVYLLSAEYLSYLNFTGDPGSALENATQPKGMSIVSVKGASQFAVTGLGPGSTTGSGDGGVATIYGGIAGLTQNPQPVAVDDGLYDTCANAPRLQPCNNRAIMPSTVLTLSFKSDSVDGVPSIEYEGSGDVAPTSLPSAEGGPVHVVRHGQVAHYSVTWLEICNVLSQQDQGINTDCSLASPGTPVTAVYTFTAVIKGTEIDPLTGMPRSIVDSLSFTVVISDGPPLLDGQNSVVRGCDPNTPTNDVGVCGFEMSSRAGKVYLGGLYGSSLLPNLSAVPIGSVLVEWAPGRNTFQNIASPAAKNLNRDHVILPMTVDPSGDLHLGSQEIKDLKAGTDYSFKIGLVDLAGNIGYFTADGDPAKKTGADYSCVTSQNPHATECHVVRP